MHNIFAHGIVPMHGSSNQAFRVVLVKQMVFAFIAHAVGVVHSLGGWQEMEFGLVLFIKSRGLLYFLRFYSINFYPTDG